MKVIIRDQRTKQYLGQADLWVLGPAEAQDFLTIPSAAQKALERNGCAVVLRYEDPPCELALEPAVCI
jgi:hypothetical protein